jgi:hypothetical protein
MLITMKESEKSFEFTIDNLETLSIKNNWCSWCVNVFISDPSGEWNSCGTGLLSFFGKKKQKSTLSKLQSIKDLKTDAESRPPIMIVWEPNMFTMQVRSNKNLANNNKDIKLDPELKKKLNMNGSDDLILHCELKKASQCSLSELVIMWYQEDIGEHLALSFLSAVAIIESW